MMRNTAWIPRLTVKPQQIYPRAQSLLWQWQPNKSPHANLLLKVTYLTASTEKPFQTAMAHQQKGHDGIFISHGHGRY